MELNFFKKTDGQKQMMSHDANSEKLRHYASEYIKNHSEELRQLARDSGLTEQETEEYLKEVKRKAEERIIKEYQEKLSERAINKHTL